MDITGPDGFEVGDVVVAATAGERFQGLMGRVPVPLLLRTSSVHGFWLRSAIWAVGIAADLEVTGVRRLCRRRLLWLRGARWILELPLGSPLPSLGDRLAFGPTQGEAEEYGGNPLPMRDADRQPR